MNYLKMIATAVIPNEITAFIVKITLCNGRYPFWNIKKCNGICKKFISNEILLLLSLNLYSIHDH